MYCLNMYFKLSILKNRLLSKYFFYTKHALSNARSSFRTNAWKSIYIYIYIYMHQCVHVYHHYQSTNKLPADGDNAINYK